MSKDQKKTITLNVDIVDNLIETLSWISSTISFWNLEEKWPTNLIKDVVDSFYDELEKLSFYDELKRVSSSHIIDK